MKQENATTSVRARVFMKKVLDYTHTADRMVGWKII